MKMTIILQKVKRYKILWLVILLIIGVVGFHYGRAYYWYLELRVYKNNEEMQKEIIKQLGSTRAGLDLCLEDFDIFGGNTRYATITILEDSENADYINPRLEEYADPANHYPVYKSFVANEILWERLKDKKYLIRMFKQVEMPDKEESEFAIGKGRIILIDLLELVDADQRERLRIMGDKPVKITLEEFEKIVDMKFGIQQSPIILPKNWTTD